MCGRGVAGGGPQPRKIAAPLLWPIQLRLQGVLEVRDLLSGAGCAQEHDFGEVVAHELDADRQAVGETPGDAYGGDTGEVHGDGAEVLVVHSEWVVDLLADTERHARCGRGDEDVVAGEGGAKVLDDAGANLLGLGVVGVVVARREGVGAEHDAALRLVPKAFLTCFTVHLVYAVSRHAQPVAHPIESGQVGGDLCRGDDVVGRQAVPRVWQANLPHVGSRVFQPPCDPLDHLVRTGLYALAHQLLHHSDPQARYSSFKLRQVVWDLHVRARGVLRVVTGCRLQEQRRVAHVAGHRSDLVKGRGEGDKPVARDAPVCRLHAHDAAQRSRLPHGAAGVGAQGPPAFARGDGGGGAARGAAGDAVEAPGVAGRAVSRVLRRRAHRELVAVRLADHDHVLAVVQQRRGVVEGLEVFEYLRATSGANAAG